MTFAPCIIFITHYNALHDSTYCFSKFLPLCHCLFPNFYDSHFLCHILVFHFSLIHSLPLILISNSHLFSINLPLFIYPSMLVLHHSLFHTILIHSLYLICYSLLFTYKLFSLDIYTPLSLFNNCLIVVFFYSIIKFTFNMFNKKHIYL